MHHPPHHDRVADRADGAHDILDLLGHLDPGVLLALLPGPNDDDEIAVRELPHDPRCGGAGLFGLMAPPGSPLVATSFRGRAAPMDPLSTRPTRPAESADSPGSADSPDREHQRVDVVVTRAGQVLSRIHLGDGSTIDPEGPAGGVVIDALHRVLGLPCPGDPPPLTDLLATLWLQELLALASVHPALTWGDAVSLHPDPGTVGRVLPSAEALASATLDFLGDVTWERLRLAAAGGRTMVPELSPHEAAWMDDTLFARWLVESFPPPEVALAVLRDGGAHEAADGVRSVLDRIGVGPPHRM